MTVCGSSRTASSSSSDCCTSWKTPASTGRITPSWPAVRAATSSRERASRRSGPCASGDRRRPVVGEQRPQLAHVVLADRLEHDLALGAAAARLHVHGMHAEQPLDGPLLEVERLDAGQRDVGLLGPDQPALAVDRVGRHPPRRRAPAHVAEHGRGHEADEAEGEAAQQRALVQAAAERRQHDQDQQRHGELAQRADRVDGDPRAVQAPRLRAHRRSGPGRRSGRAARRRRRRAAAGSCGCRPRCGRRPSRGRATAR